MLARHGVQDKKIASTLGVGFNTVRRWKKRNGPEDRQRSGRPPSILDEDAKAKITELCKDSWGASIHKAAKTLNQSEEYIQSGRTISNTTVRRFVRSTDWGRVAFVAKKAPLLSAKNLNDRQLFSAKVVREGYCLDLLSSKLLLDHILFTDESIIELHPLPNSQNTRIRTLDIALRQPVGIPKHPLKIMVAGGLSANGLTELHICDPISTVTVGYYRNRILPVYISALARTSVDGDIDQRRLFDDSNRVVFMQDGAPAHTAKVTLDMLANHFNIVLSKGFWPGNLPDLNPIEHIWADLQASVFFDPRPCTREELVLRVLHAWRAVSIDHTKRLVYSFRRRIMQCHERHGASTDY